MKGWLMLDEWPTGDYPDFYEPSVGAGIGRQHGMRVRGRKRREGSNPFPRTLRRNKWTKR